MQHLRMTIDEWRDRVDHSSTIDEPSWDQVKQAIVALDGIVKTIVTLSKNDETYMMVCGQWENLYMVNASFNNENFFSLIDPRRSPRKVILFVGGQNGDFEENKCISRSQALDAAEHYYLTGELKGTLPWTS